MSKARRTFGDQVLALKLRVLSRTTDLVSTGNNISSYALPVTSPTISHALLLMTSMADKLAMETEPVARDSNAIFMVKPGDQTFAAPHTTCPIACIAKWQAVCQ